MHISTTFADEEAPIQLASNGDDPVPALPMLLSAVFRRALLHRASGDTDATQAEVVLLEAINSMLDLLVLW
jgi:hypothetical protein